MQVFFEYNGIPRVVEVREESKAAAATKKVRGAQEEGVPGARGLACGRLRAQTPRPTLPSSTPRRA